MTDENKVKNLIEQFGSIEGFLNYLSEGKWLEKDLSYTPEIKQNIINERLTRQIGRSSILEANLENIIVNNTFISSIRYHLIYLQQHNLILKQMISRILNLKNYTMKLNLKKKP